MKKTKKVKCRCTFPTNYSCWIDTLKNPELVVQFIKRGDKRQHDEIIHALLYMENIDREKFKQINGKEILRRFKN